MMLSCMTPIYYNVKYFCKECGWSLVKSHPNIVSGGLDLLGMLGIPQECPSCKCTSIKKGDASFTDTLNPIEPFRRLWYTGKGIASIIKKCRRK
ncbi:MAG: hypothetical protein ACUZ8H_10490 [Candidatus Anammoxibacter sp.]